MARRFTALCGDRAEREARLRRLILADVTLAEERRPLTETRGRAQRVMVRLTAEETEAVDQLAASIGFARSAWVAALVRRRLLGRPTFARPDVLSLMAIRSELRRMGLALKQMTASVQAAVAGQQSLESELAAIGRLQRELHDIWAGLGQAFHGNLDYWDPVDG